MHLLSFHFRTKRSSFARIIVVIANSTAVANVLLLYSTCLNENEELRKITY